MKECTVHEQSTLMRWSKRRLADYVICLEENNNALRWQLDNQYKAFKEFLDNES